MSNSFCCRDDYGDWGEPSTRSVATSAPRSRTAVRLAVRCAAVTTPGVRELRDECAQRCPRTLLRSRHVGRPRETARSEPRGSPGSQTPSLPARLVSMRCDEPPSSSSTATSGSRPVCTRARSPQGWVLDPEAAC